MQQRYAFLAQQFALFRQPVLILDLEATGGDLMRDRITEIAFLRFDGDSVQHFSQLINPQQEISPFITELTGISNEMVQHAPTFAELLPEILPLLRGAILVAHNARFDYSLLSSECARAGVAFATQTLCTVKLSKALYPHEYKHNLDVIAERFALTAEGSRHRAWADVAMLADFLQLALAQHDWLPMAMNLLQPATLPEHLPAQIRAILAHEFSDRFGVVRIQATCGRTDILLCEQAFQETVAWLNRHANQVQQIENIEFYPTIGALHNVFVYAKLVQQYGLSLPENGRHTVQFYAQQGCLKAKIRPLASGVMSEPPTGVFFHPKAAKKAVQEWAGQVGICPTWLGILPYSPPKSAPCPVSLLKNCACESGDVAAHNALVQSHRYHLPTVDWLPQPRLQISETDVCTGQTLNFVVERGALRLDDGTWFVCAELLNVLKHKFKSERKTVAVI